ncbi:MAG TPA: DUF1345 domain-containing protein [Candidatus Saccharimonadales bacterium]|nr:DUF1345 domain-containing protein [Candidatus Saccharimonadales bacterium]
MKRVRKKQTRFAVAVIVAIVAGVVGGMVLGWKYASLVGWDLGAITFLAMLWRDFAGHSEEHTAIIAKRDDMNRSTTDVLLIIASVISIVAVAILLTRSAGHSESTTILDVGFGLLSIVISWATVHSIFMLRYAAMYYQGEEGGADFHNSTRTSPGFGDFAYLAFTIGMTYQVSDTDLKTPAFRRTAIRHALLSFVFGTAIIATTINFIASLAR